jgi:peptidoglycan/xylan/chitin deacetylase (PgdA/CDA1 family)
MRTHAAALLALRALLAALLGSSPAFAAPAPAGAPVEVHQRLVLPADSKAVALTLDACGGDYDAQLINFLIGERIPATIFATRKWLDRNAGAMAVLRAHPALFVIEDHGANHVPPVIGAGRRVYGIPGSPDLAHLENEIRGGATAIEASTGVAPRWYRGATAVYDPQALRAIAQMGYKVAGFSVNADAGATLKRAAIVERMRRVRPGDIIIAHMNKPHGDTAEGLAEGLRLLKQQGYEFVTLGAMSVEPVSLSPGAARNPRT